MASRLPRSPRRSAEPSKMKAWRVHTHGGPEVVRREDVAMPEPGPMEVRVRVEAVGLNHLDLWVRKGVAGHKFPLPLVPGCDVAGVVDAWGPGVEGLNQGAPVLLQPGISCGRCEACFSGFDPLCARYGILGETRDGGMAEFIVVPWANLIARPAGMTAEEAAALPRRRARRRTAGRVRRRRGARHRDRRPRARRGLGGTAVRREGTRARRRRVGRRARGGRSDRGAEAEGLKPRGA